MEYLWTPWRMQYINSNHLCPENQGCVFCEAIKQPEAFENLVVKRGSQAYVVLNRFPYNNGHLLVVPYQHVSMLSELSAEIQHEMMDLANLSVTILKELYNAQGFNLGFNIGSAAGAGIAGHIHMHIIPRWNGDTNFISTIGQTRVLPEEMTETYNKLKMAFE